MGPGNVPNANILVYLKNGADNQYFTGIVIRNNQVLTTTECIQFMEERKKIARVWVEFLLKNYTILFSDTCPLDLNVEYKYHDIGLITVSRLSLIFFENLSFYSSVNMNPLHHFLGAGSHSQVRISLATKCRWRLHKSGSLSPYKN